MADSADRPDSSRIIEAKVEGEVDEYGVADGGPYLYVEGELIVNTEQLEIFAQRVDELPDEFRVDLETAQPITDEYTLLTDVEGPIPALVELLRSDDLDREVIDAFPHHAVSIQNHTWFGPQDAPKDLGPRDPGWDAAAAANIKRKNRNGLTAVVIDTGVLPVGRRVIPKDALGQHSDVDPPGAGGLSGALDPYLGHGTFVAGHILAVAPEAIVHVFRPKGLGTGPDGRLVLSDGEFARVLARALATIAAGHPVNVPVGQAKQVAEEACQKIKQDPSLKPAVLNLSIAGPAHLLVSNPLPQTKEILDIWLGCEIPIVAAAGNESRSDPFYPAAYPRVCGVGALDPKTKTTAWFSNRDGKTNWVSEWADGIDTFSAFLDGGSPAESITVSTPPAGHLPPPHANIHSSTKGRWNGFALWSGTSFATPQIAGAFANPNLPDPC